MFPPDILHTKYFILTVLYGAMVMITGYDQQITSSISAGTFVFLDCSTLCIFLQIDFSVKNANFSSH